MRIWHLLAIMVVVSLTLALEPLFRRYYQMFVLALPSLLLIVVMRKHFARPNLGIAVLLLVVLGLAFCFPFPTGMDWKPGMDWQLIVGSMNALLFVTVVSSVTVALSIMFYAFSWNHFARKKYYLEKRYVVANKNQPFDNSSRVTDSHLTKESSQE